MSSSRDRILETAARMVAEQGIAAVTMAAVARESGVSRQMVYLHFSNRAGLFSAVTHHMDERAGLRERFQRALDLEPVEALETIMRVWIDYVPLILPIARELHAAALTAAEGGEAWHERMDELRRAFRFAARRVKLRDPWTPETAGDWIWSRTHVTVYDQLVSVRGWSREDFAERTVRSVLRELLA